MPKSIQLLSEEMINQIAAGEVVEGPASVVKELVENAIDAKASKISVQIVGGGLVSIIVADNGSGMQKDDAVRSILRHATSKIRTANDLLQVGSMGFRGEALASIASVSEMMIETSQDGAGVCLEVIKGKVISVRPTARTRGTTITVRQLFYNVPARKKFQKSPSALASEVFRLVTSLALGNPLIQFDLISNSRKVLGTREKETLNERVVSVLGNDFFKDALPLKYDKESFSFEGIICSPTVSRPNRKAQYLFLNGRFVLCEAISNAVKRGFGTCLDEKRHPLFLINLKVPYELVDVNVHPQKLFIRLRNEDLFNEAVCQAVEKTLGLSPLPPPSKIFFSSSSNPQNEDLWLSKQEFLQEKDNITSQKVLPSFETNLCDIVGIFEYFILTKEENCLALVNAKAANFRIIFEELMRNKSLHSSKQGLLVPLSVRLTHAEVQVISGHRETIEKLGFSIKLLNQEELKIEALPPFLSEKEVKDTLIEIAFAVEQFIGKIDYKEKNKEKLCQIIAARGRLKKVASNEEAEKILRKLSLCKQKTYCPKGEKIKVLLDVETIEQIFKSNSSITENSQK